MTKKIRGSGRPRLSLRGKHRGVRLAARLREFNAVKDNSGAYHAPGSGKK